MQRNDMVKVGNLPTSLSFLYLVYIYKYIWITIINQFCHSVLYLQCQISIN